MTNGSSSEDDFFTNMIVKITAVDALEVYNDSDTKVGFKVFEGARKFACGA